MISKSTAAMAVCILMVAAGAAEAADKATGWKNWADHAERVLAASDSGNLAEVDSACIGTTRTIIGQGFQFPYWGQMLPQFCRQVETKNVERKVTLRGWMQECKQLRQVKGALEKASDVAEEPRAKPLADRMVATLAMMDTRDCSHPPRR